MSRKTKIKVTKPDLDIPINRDQAEERARELRDWTARKKLTLATLDRQRIHLEKSYESTFIQINSAIEKATQELQAWAEANPGEFGKRKSLDLMHAVLGWRTGTPRLKTLPKWTFDKVLERIQRVALFKRYVRKKLSIDKEAIIGDRDQFEEKDLKQVGLTIVQDETFFIDPKIEEVDPKYKDTKEKAA